RGVDVPVVPGAAGRASPVPGGQAQLCQPVPARRAGFGGGIPAVYDDQAAAVPLALVRKLTAELAPAAIGDGAGEMAVADHLLDREVLDHDEIGLVDQPGTGLVQEVPPRGAYLAVRAGDLEFRLFPVRGPLLAAGQAPL